MYNRSDLRSGITHHNLIANDAAHIHAGDVNFFLHTGAKQEHQCFQAFKTTNYEDQKDRNPPRVEGTCRWVLTHPQFLAWRQSQGDDLLWISADPGCGKSVFAKSLVDGDLKDPNTPLICYFFFKDNEDQDNLSNAMCAILHQLFVQRPQLIQYALPLFEKMGLKVRYETQEMWRILQSIACDLSIPPIVCVLDALDECRDFDRRQLITFLCQLPQPVGSSTMARMKFLVTSRPYDNVERWFEYTVSRWPHIRLRGEEESESITQEINLVINQHVRSLAKEFKLSQNSQNQLKNTLENMKNRTYLWLHLAIDEIRETYRDSLYPDTVIIQSLPQSVEDAYEHLLQKITQKQRSNARQILLIIVGARRPLKIAEMAWALASTHSQLSGYGSLALPGLDHLEQQIRHWCGLFVFIQHSTLFLIHQTAREFLLATNATIHTPGRWRGTLNSYDVDLEMVNICITYLTLTYHDESRNFMAKWASGTDVDCMVEFFEYCAVYWSTHLPDGSLQKDPSLMSRVMALFDHRDSLFSVWFNDLLRASNFYPVQRMFPQHAMAWIGSKDLLEELYTRTQFSVDARGSFGSTALHLAVSRGHLEAVKWLLEKGADIHLMPPGQRHLTDNALYRAAENNHTELVKLLLENGADVNTELCSLYGTALHAACVRGNLEVVQALLDRGAGTNNSRLSLSRALCSASQLGHVDIVQILLNSGISPESEGRTNTALCAAIEKNHTKIAKMLLDHKADANAEGFSDYSHYNVARNEAEVISGGFPYYPLYMAAKHGNVDIVRALIDRGAEINTLSRLGTVTALAAAADMGHEEVVQILLDRGANINICEEASPLHRAVSRGDTTIVKMLLNRGAYVNNIVGGPDDTTPLQVARKKCRQDIEQLLIDAGAREEAPKKRITASSVATNSPVTRSMTIKERIM